jgi:phospholipid/cholesterol/gamma-HCH transport system permease protein
VGTAICADLGARKVREELDALMVLGIDPIRSLVVPRLLAVMSLTALFDVYALVFGTFGGMLVTISNGAPLGPFFSTYFTNATTVEFAASLGKTTLFGAIIALVCCYKGLTAKGGSEGVGRAVNQAIVISFLAIGAVDYVFTQALLATHPELTSVR